MFRRCSLLSEIRSFACNLIKTQSERTSMNQRWSRELVFYNIAIPKVFVWSNPPAESKRKIMDLHRFSNEIMRANSNQCFIFTQSPPWPCRTNMHLVQEGTAICCLLGGREFVWMSMTVFACVMREKRGTKLMGEGVM